MNSKKLLFVYNADSGIVNAVMDSLHKVFSPATYDCNLCAITYTAVSMKKEWRSFIKGLPLPVVFLHRDELINKYGRDDIALPSVLVVNGKLPDILIDAAEINQVDSLEQLIALVNQKINSLNSE